MADDDSIENLFACQAESDADSAPQIISRQDAIALGFVTYFTGKPCKQGHIAERYVITRNCVNCAKENSKRQYCNLAKDGLTEAQLCSKKLAQKVYRKINREKLRQANKIYNKFSDKKRVYYKTHLEKIKATSRARYAANPEERNRAMKIWYKNNLDKVRKTRKIWKKKNPTWKNDYHRKLYLENILYRLVILMRSSITRAIKSIGKKSQRTMAYVGCTPNKLANYLESQFKEGMAWENIGVVWEIDHIIAFCTVDCADDEELKRVAHYTNLQPLFVEEHKKKTVEDVKKKFKHKIDPNYSCLIELDLLE